VLGPAGKHPAAAVTTLITNLAELVAAVADLRQVQGRAHQEAAARKATGQLRQLARCTAIQGSSARTSLVLPVATPVKPVPPRQRQTVAKPHIPTNSP
jgi:hypothetical protein